MYRDAGLFYKEKVGSAKLSRYYFDEAKWTNVGKWDYFFTFFKANDGVTLKSNNVVMKGY